MRTITLTLLTVLIGMNVLAQGNDIPEKENSKKTIVRPAGCPVVYITTSTGINNNTGILGFNFDVPINKNISIDAGAGTGTWGNKLYAGAKYYLRPCQRGFAFGAGLTYCPGVNHDEHDLTTIYGNTERISYNKNPQMNMLIAAYKYWNLGKKYNRFYMELGYSVSLNTGDKISQLSGDPISTDDMNSLKSGAPGGLILAAGFSFGLH